MNACAFTTRPVRRLQISTVALCSSMQLRVNLTLNPDCMRACRELTDNLLTAAGLPSFANTPALTFMYVSTPSPPLEEAGSLNFFVYHVKWSLLISAI